MKVVVEKEEKEIIEIEGIANSYEEQTTAAWNSDKDRYANPLYDTAVYPMCRQTHYNRTASSCPLPNGVRPKKTSKDIKVYKLNEGHNA